MKKARESNRPPFALAGGAIVLLALVSGCTPESPQRIVCKSFDFSLQKDEWTEVRRLMHELAIESPGNPPFIDESYEDLASRRYLRLKIERKGTGITSQLDGSIFRDGDTARFSVIDSRRSDRSQPCGSLIPEDYEMAKRKFSRRWAITESGEVHSIPEKSKGKS